MTRKTLSLCLLFLIISAIVSLYTWLNLPDLESYPIHWNAQGTPNAFGSRKDVALLLVMMPAIMGFTLAMLYFVPKLEPLKDNFNQSLTAYNIISVSIMAVLLVTAIVIGLSYQAGLTSSQPFLTKAIFISVSILLIIIGNYLGKIRQNFMFGIRTPWTLSSDLSWEKTHRLGGRLFVLAGILSLLAQLILGDKGFYGFIFLVLLAVIVPIIYSYFIWKLDPLKRQSGL